MKISEYAIGILKKIVLNEIYRFTSIYMSIYIHNLSKSWAESLIKLLWFIYLLFCDVVRNNKYQLLF